MTRINCPTNLPPKFSHLHTLAYCFICDICRQYVNIINLMTALLIFLGIVILLVLWLALAPVELMIDTRVPFACVRLVSIGTASVQFEEEEFWLNVQILFIRFTWRTDRLAKKKKKRSEKPVRKKRPDTANLFRKMFRVWKCVRVRQFELQLKPSDYTVTGRLYPLNFIRLPNPYILSVSLNEDAYLVARITTVPWRIAYALIRK